MSKIAKKPITILEGVTIQLQGDVVNVNGPKGTLTFAVPQDIGVEISTDKVQIVQKNESNPQSKALAGLTRATIANMVKGVSSGFEKKLELTGVGYRAQVTGADLVLNVGFSHPVKITAVAGVTFAYADNAIIVSGADKALVGNIAAKVRAVRPPEPYKGKGIKYMGEHIRRKAGKAAKAVGGK
ncbi:MAG TPA: 50S ribosomal protein L6 [Candidatus Saccharimonadales bacterium]|nr:50S ribosomal protein L6 [Candidatus Saccharimonadales bacterium]